MSFDVIVLGLFRQVEAVELQPSGHLLLSLEESQRDLEVVVGDQHAQRDEGMGDSQNADDIFLKII